MTLSEPPHWRLEKRNNSTFSILFFNAWFYRKSVKTNQRHWHSLFDLAIATTSSMKLLSATMRQRQRETVLILTIQCIPLREQEDENMSVVSEVRCFNSGRWNSDWCRQDHPFQCTDWDTKVVAAAAAKLRVFQCHCQWFSKRAWWKWRGWHGGSMVLLTLEDGAAADAEQSGAAEPLEGQVGAVGVGGASHWTHRQPRNVQPPSTENSSWQENNYRKCGPRKRLLWWPPKRSRRRRRLRTAPGMAKYGQYCFRSTSLHFLRSIWKTFWLGLLLRQSGKV